MGKLLTDETGKLIVNAINNNGITQQRIKDMEAGKENASNKKQTIDESSVFYPSNIAVKNYVANELSEPNSKIESLKSGKLDKTDFNTYKTATDKAVKDNTTAIGQLKLSKADLIQSKNIFDMTSYLNFLKAVATKPVVNGTLDNIDSSSFTFTATSDDCFTTGWSAPSGTAFKIPVQQNTTYTMSWDFSGSDGITFVFFNGVSESGNMVQVKSSKKMLTFTTKEDTTFITVRFGINDSGTSATIGNIQIELGEIVTEYMPCRVATGVKELDNKVDKLQDFNKTKFTAIAADIDDLKVKSLPSVNLILPSAITTIPDIAFCANQSIISVTIPDSVTSIGINAFKQCKNLVSATIGSGITSINIETFWGCTSLSSVTIPNSVTNISSSAFALCTSLSSVTIPDSVTNIGISAFSGCTSLSSVTLGNGFNANNLNLSASTKYTADTIVSWLNALADRTGQTVYTLTIGSTNIAKLTEAEIAIATNKNWTLA